MGSGIVLKITGEPPVPLNSKLPYKKILPTMDCLICIFSSLVFLNSSVSVRMKPDFKIILYFI